ncbi:MAG: hypothetical protein K8R73_04125 [Clostridiales bacterium]|nr:hypothetical protein [Clostridiales bacterium]
MIKKIKKYRAVTVVELLIVIGIIGIVMAVGSSLLVFGTRTMRISETKASNQFDVRVPIGQIEDLIRYAGQLEIIDTPPISGSLDNYVILDSGVDNQIVHYVNGVEKKIPGLSVEGGYDFQVKLKSGTTNTIVLRLAKSGVAGFNLETEIVVLNLAGNDVEGLTEGIGFTYGEQLESPVVVDDVDEEDDSEITVTIDNGKSGKKELQLVFSESISNVVMTSADSIDYLGLNRYRFNQDNKFPDGSSLIISFKDASSNDHEIKMILDGQNWSLK